MMVFGQLHCHFVRRLLLNLIGTLIKKGTEFIMHQMVASILRGNKSGQFSVAKTLDDTITFDVGAPTENALRLSIGAISALMEVEHIALEKA